MIYSINLLTIIFVFLFYIDRRDIFVPDSI